MYLAKAVRDGIEDFHAEHLSDDQTAELNPLIRNALLTALHALENYERSEAATMFVEEAMRQIPDHWEEPELERYYQLALSGELPTGRQSTNQPPEAFLKEPTT